LIKNYSFPLEELVLQNPRLVDGMPIPQAPAELILFVMRIMLKHVSLIEYLLLRRRDRSGYKAMQEELASLLADDAAAQCSELLAEWLPSVDSVLFHECMDALRSDAFFPRRFWLALRLSRQLGIYNRFSFMSAIFLRASLFFKLFSRRLGGGGKAKQFVSGGRLIAFVGPEATGKSTLVRETKSWLSKAFDVSSAHLGKPPSTWLSFLPNLALPLLREAAPGHRVGRVKHDASRRDTRSVSLLYALRAVLLAWDRRALAAKLRRKVANGSLVICDRYPSAVVGAMDSARLKILSDSRDTRNKLLNRLARLENRIYRQVPPPDVVIRLTVPVEVAMARNQERQKREEVDYVLRRHMASTVPEFPLARTIQLDSNQLESQTVHSARQIVWDAL
jgi:thymidylate kinase